MRIVLEAGRSDLQRFELDQAEPPEHVDRDGERYGPGVDHFDQPMRDITGAGRHRLCVP
ncbi:hypothetical protein [Microlunatus flavus]|uniref:hypothetical protein n=1 Tax=Microlunatus flavus TaxID=1036181 RepID=UPI00147A09BC|nr:hypothetical protein [Microlunatus flavus]